jgi:hypothetical protein
MNRHDRDRHQQRAGARRSVHSMMSRPAFICGLPIAVVLAAFTAMPLAGSAQTAAQTARIQITLVKTARGGGSGILFYETQKYGLGISGPRPKGIWTTRVDLVGEVSNLRNAKDIIGTFTAVNGGFALLERSKTAVIENPKGVRLEIRGVNLKRSFSLDLSGMMITNVGWEPSQE